MATGRKIGTDNTMMRTVAEAPRDVRAMDDVVASRHAGRESEQVRPASGNCAHARSTGNYPTPSAALTDLSQLRHMQLKHRATILRFQKKFPSLDKHYGYGAPPRQRRRCVEERRAPGPRWLRPNLKGAPVDPNCVKPLCGDPQPRAVGGVARRRAVATATEIPFAYPLLGTGSHHGVPE